MAKKCFTKIEEVGEMEWGRVEDEEGVFNKMWGWIDIEYPFAPRFPPVPGGGETRDGRFAVVGPEDQQRQCF